VPRGSILPLAELRRPAEQVARELLGAVLERRLDGERLALRIVETEAYIGPEDRACHASGGRRTPRTEVMFLPGGHAYVYFVYGMHHCLNVVTGPKERGEAVLIRAGEPLEGLATMQRLRGLALRDGREPRPGDLAGGPAKLCDALSIGLAQNGARFDRGDLVLRRGTPVPEAQVARGPRVGVDYAGEAAAWPLRFAIRGSRHVSKPPVESRDA
jgi:DNA-3-methyladenine glycosylase